MKINISGELNIFTAFSVFTAKRCKKYVVKLFFLPHFTAFLTKIHRQTSTWEMPIRINFSRYFNFCGSNNQLRVNFGAYLTKKALIALNFVNVRFMA